MEEVVKSVSEVGDFEHEQQQVKQQYISGRTTNAPMPVATGGTMMTMTSSSKGPGPGEETKVIPSDARSKSSRFLPSLLNATLPSKVAIIVGLCQVGLGVIMVLVGILAIRYQSYLFHYGTGLWTGILSCFTGLLGVMCTKRGVHKPTWLCGGTKWQVHVFLLAIVFSLSSAILLAIFSISGLLQDARTIMTVDKTYQLLDDSETVTLEELLESKNTSGIFINTILLLLSVLEILLCFSSLGIAVRVMFRSKGTLLSATSREGSTGSEIRDGMEYHTRKDHLVHHWLGHVTETKGSPGQQVVVSRKGPPFVALQPTTVLYPHPHPRRMVPHLVPIHQPPYLIGPFASPQQHGPTHLVPICTMYPTPTPSVIVPPPPSSRTSQRRRMTLLRGNGAVTPVSSIASLSIPQEHYNSMMAKRHQQMMMMQMQMQHQQQQQQQQSNHSRQRTSGSLMSRVPGGSSGVGSSALMGTASTPNNNQKSFSVVSSSKAPSVIESTAFERNNEVEVTEVDVSRTYTGLDRSIADDYICAMNSRKASSSAREASLHDSGGGEKGVNKEDEDEDSDIEITRM